MNNNVTYRVAVENDIAKISRLNKVHLLKDENPNSQKGFVVVPFASDLLSSIAPLGLTTVCECNGVFAGYLVVMDWAEAGKIDYFQKLIISEQYKFDGQDITADNSVVLGQVCISEEFQGQGLLRGFYEHLRKISDKTFTLSEVERRNEISLLVHQRLGMKVVGVYESDGLTWDVVSMQL